MTVLSFSKFLEEGVNDPAIFKAVFLAGGPGSGKSFIVGRTGLPALGYRVVNSDDAFEAAMRKAGMVMSPEAIFSAKGQELRGKAKELTSKKEALYVQGRLGLVIDGTGKDVDKVKSQIAKVKKLGYDVAMIFVNTDLDTALERNRQRERSLPDKEVETYWKDVQKNVGAFQELFGSQNFHVVDNSKGKDFRVETLRAYKNISKFTKAEVKNNIARDWIQQQRKKTNEAIDFVKVGKSVMGNISKMTHKKEYNAALRTLSSVVKRKEPGKHSIEYYASRVSQSFPNVDYKMLAKMFKKATNA